MASYRANLKTFIRMPGVPLDPQPVTPPPPAPPPPAPHCLQAGCHQEGALGGGSEHAQPGHNQISQ